jgi:hypothetical protein
MSLLFPNKPLLGTKSCGVSFTYDIREKIEKEEYLTAADLILSMQLPFNQTVRLLSNCPKALAAYFFKYSASINPTPAQKQIVCHLFIETQLGVINSTLNNKEKTEEQRKLKEFINEHQNNLDPDTVIKLIKHYGETSLLAEICIIFKRYEMAIEALTSGSVIKANIKQILGLILNLKEDKQRQTFLRFIAQSRKDLYEAIDESLKLENLDALFDTLAILVSISPYDVNIYQEDILKTFEVLRQEGLITKPIHYTMMFLLFILLKKDAQIEEFMKSKEFGIIDHDFIATYCASHGNAELAAKIYAKVPNRHVAAVGFLINTVFNTQEQTINLKPLIDLFKNDLRRADDLRDCWLIVLRKARSVSDKLTAKNWNDIVSEATKNRTLSLDDIFPLIPEGMSLDELHTTISSAVGQSSKTLAESEKVREQIKARMQEQRAIVTNMAMKPIELDPMDARCIFCGQSVCDSGFDVYPCGHVAHISCLTSNMTTFTKHQDIYGDLFNPEALTKALSASCPACGLVSLNVLDKKFVDEEYDYEAISDWDVPF